LQLPAFFWQPRSWSRVTRPKEIKPAAQQTTQTTQNVFVVFEGPWAFAPDPKDANSVLALAPKTKSHHDLVVQSSDKTLTPGIYDLSLPARSGPATGTVDPNILQAKIDAQSVQHVLDNKLERYAIRLPKPEAYVAATHYRSRAGSAYPPDASTEKDYVTSVSLRYSVTTLNGFSLAGSPDSGAFNPLLLQVETPIINFVIGPAHDPDPADKCNTHSRESFRDLTKLLNLTLFVDFPNDPSECHGKDPQNPRPAKAEIDHRTNDRRSLLERAAALVEGNLADVQDASVASSSSAPSFLRSFVRGSAGSLKQHLLAAIYFFGTQGGTCRAPIIVGGG
jgi:hypothetical protein